MSKAKLAAARELIEEKKYVEARDLLLTIKDDPTAAKWLVKLEERIGSSRLPVKSTPPPAPPVQSSAPRNFNIVGREELVRNLMPPPEEPLPPVENMRTAGCFRTVWGLLTLAALAWIAYGFLATASATGNQLNSAQAQTSQAYQAGTVLGGTIGISIFLCTGVPLLVLFGLLYWRNGVAIRETKKHNQMVAAMRSRR